MAYPVIRPTCRDFLGKKQASTQQTIRLLKTLQMADGLSSCRHLWQGLRWLPRRLGTLGACGQKSRQPQGGRHSSCAPQPRT